MTDWRSKNGYFYPQYKSPYKLVNRKEMKRNGLFEATCMNFMTVVNDGREFTINKVFSNKNNRSICYKLHKTIKSPLLEEDKATYYIMAMKRFFKGWNISPYDTVDPNEVRNKACIPKYYEQEGIGIQAEVIDSMIHDDGMSCLVIGIPSGIVDLDQFNNVTSDHFSASYHYLSREKMKEYLAEYIVHAHYESEFRGPCYGFPKVLFSDMDPFL